MTKLNTAAYCRVSTDKYDQANSLESQKKYFAEYIQKNDNMHLIKVYYDEGISGTSVNKRKAFNEMIESALNGEIDLIITKEVSRFARNTVDTLEYTRMLRKAGVGVIFTCDNIDTRIDKDEFRLTVMASIAQEESRKTSERVKWGQTRRMEQGVVFGRDLLGYTVKNGRLFINEEEAETVKLIFHKFLNEGKGTHTIARELREEGIKPKRVSEWSNTVILRVLRNEKYAGDLLQKKTFTPDFLSHKKKCNNGEEEKVYIKDHHEPIISRAVWNNTQEELQKRSLSPAQKSRHSNRYWCSGKLVCGECGRRMVSHTRKRKNGTENKTWRCSENVKNGNRKADKSDKIVGCNNGSVNDKTLLSAIGYCLKLFQTDFKEIKHKLIEEIKSVQNICKSEDTKSLYEKIESIRKKKLKAVDCMLDGFITENELKEQKLYYDQEITEIQTKIESINNHEKKSKKHTTDDYIKEIDRITQFDTSETELYCSVLDKIVAYKNDTLTVYLKNLPFGIILSYTTSGKGDSYSSDFRYIGTENVQYR